LRGIDVAFDGSYAVAAARAKNQVAVLQIRTDGQNPFFQVGGAGNPFGALLFRQDAGGKPIAVAIADRIAFGQPVVKIVSPSAVAVGQRLTLRGSNLTPFTNLTVTIGGFACPIVRYDGLTMIEVTVPTGVPTGDQDLVVTNSTIQNSLKNSAPVKVTVL
ncbi:MAG: IPT/TIG domain-containing protein, partial [Candidatus Riflebacteria bacterium]|nr:IPT/TIG domain-containing protein [Candidatus Riflebacteria bacterium]